MPKFSRHVRNALVPRAVAVVGATDREGAVGRVVWQNLLEANFKGELYAVNPSHARIGKHTCYARLSDLPAKVDLVVVATKAATVPQIVVEAAQCGATGVLVLSSGFAETRAAGRHLEDQALHLAREHGVRLFGANSMGIIRPTIGLNASLMPTPARSGTIGLVSESGALACALLDYARTAGFGFSTVLTLGEGTDVGFADLIDFLALDGHTRSIVVYVESVRQPRGFLSSLRAAASIKPVVVLKSGRFAQGSPESMGHLGALTGNDAVFDTALRRTGAIRISKYAQLFSASEALMAGNLPAGPRLAVVGNGHAPGVLAADVIEECGLKLAQFSDATLARVQGLRSASSAHARWKQQTGVSSGFSSAGGNPVDLGAQAEVASIVQALEGVLADPNTDGALLLAVPSLEAGSAELARALLPVLRASRKTVVTGWLGEAEAAVGRAVLREAGFVAMRGPEQAVEAFGVLARYVQLKELRLQLPPPRQQGSDAVNAIDSDRIRAILAQAQGEQRWELPQDVAHEVLAASGVPVASQTFARSSESAVAAAHDIGYPVVLKVRASGVWHKSDVGGVRLNLRSAQDVISAFNSIRDSLAAHAPDAVFEGVLVQRLVAPRNGRELTVGISRDPFFGPVMRFGMGGITVDVVSDAALALPPLNRMLAEDLISRTRVATMLQNFRGMPAVDAGALIEMLLRVSDLACEFPCINDLDINPIVADEHGVVALDVRMRIDASPLSADAVYSHLAIHPYPRYLEQRLELHDGSSVLMRPVRPEDAEAQKRFVSRLSDLTLYRRFHAPIRELSPERLVRFTQIDYDREMAFVAIDLAPGQEDEIRAFGQYARMAGNDEAEFGIAVEDSWQGRGLGFAMMEAIESCARARHVRQITGFVLADNDAMRAMMVARGYHPERDPDDPGVVNFSLLLVP